VSPLYRLAGVKVRRGDREVLDVARLELKAGRVIAVVGPNGAGKSTLLELLACLLLPAAGRVEFDGQTVDAANVRSCARRIALVAQEPFLFDRSVAANVRLGPALRGLGRAVAAGAADAALEQLGIAHLAGRHARELSGGEARRVAIARMLAIRPEVLLLDEPFNSLDNATAAGLAAAISDPARLGTRGTVFTTHDEALALRLADEVVNVVDGAVQRGALMNVYAGRLDPVTHTFDTGRLVLHVADHVTTGTRVALDPAHVVLSAARLDSSMRNVFEGRVAQLAEHAGDVLVTVQAGERLHALITHAAARTQGLQPGCRVWVSFKSNALRVF